MPTIKTLHVSSLAGGMETRKPQMDLKPDELSRIENLHWDMANGWSTEDAGYVFVNATALNGGAAIQSIYTFTDVTSLEHTLVQAGDTLYQVDILDGEITNTLGTTHNSPNHYVPFLGWCFVLNPSAAPQRWNGQTQTLEAMPGWPPSFGSITPGNPGFGCVFANRLVLAGDASNPNILYLSALENPENFTPDGLEDSPGAIQISPGDGQRITGLVPLYVPYSNEHVLLIFKNESIYALRGFNASTFRLELVSNTLGTVSPRSVMAVGQDVWFLSKSGINALGPNTELGILAVGSISPAMQGRLERVNQSRLDRAFALHDPIRQEIWWCLPTGSATLADEVWVQHYGQRPFKWSLKTGLAMTCGNTLPNGLLFTGNANGFWQQQRVGESYNGSPMPWQLQSAAFALGEFSATARLSQLDVYLANVSAGAFEASVQWELDLNDGGDPLTPSFSITSGAGNLYGAGLYNTARYGANARAVARLYPEGSGRLAQLTLSGESPAQPVAITGYSLTYIEGGNSAL